MSADEDDGPVGTREVAHRVFAAEYDQATVSFKEGEEERAPSYVVTPSGAKANRLFFVGVLTEIEDVNEDMLRARIVDPTGAFVVYAGQYQPDARTFFERATPPEFVAVSGKARTFTPEDSDRVFTSVRPESVNAVDADTRDRWVLDATEATLGRVGAMARALQAGADDDPESAGLDPTGGIAIALAEYGTTPAYLAALRDLSLDAARVVAGDRDEVRPLETDPVEPGSADLEGLSALAERSAVPVELPETVLDDSAEPTPSEAGSTADDRTDAAEAGVPESGSETATASETNAVSESTTADDTEPETATTEQATSTTEQETATTDSEEGAAETTTAGSSTEAATDAGTSTADDDLGDFEPGGFDETENGDDVEVEGSPDDMYELDEDERREVEEEYGTEFSTGTEVEAPGEAGIETPEPKEGEPVETDVESEAAEPASPTPGAETDATDTGTESPEAGEETVPGDEPDVEDEVASGDDGGAEDEAATGEEADAGEDADVDLDEYVIDRMRELDDGNGADRERLVAAVVDETGADPGEVEDAIQDALMGGQCYEPNDDTLKPI